MDRILKIKDEYISKVTTININGNAVKLREGMSEKLMNYLYDNGYNKYFDVIQAVSLTDESIWVDNAVERTEPVEWFVKPMFNKEPTPTPAIKKKDVAVKTKNNKDADL